MLDKNLDEANVQYQIAIRNHLIHIDTLSEVICPIFRSSIHAYMAWWKNSREMYRFLSRNTQLSVMKCRRHIMIIWSSWMIWLKQSNNKIDVKLRRLALMSKLSERRLKIKIWKIFSIWNLTLRQSKPNIILS